MSYWWLFAPSARKLLSFVIYDFSMKEAKERLIADVGTNILLIVITGLFTIWLTPFLIKHLQVSLFGMVVLFNSLVEYLNVFALGIIAAVGRFAAILR